MTARTITSAMFVNMVEMGAANLRKHRDSINKLNVFPVPDGDTGTNMNLSMTSALKELNKLSTNDMPTILNAFIKGLLMGARGNSGVLLSQLFRGFSLYLIEQEEISLVHLAQAFDAGVKTAYKAVTNPVEGTILTVAKDLAKAAQDNAQTANDPVELMEKVVEEANASLKRTPDLLPILKEVGVVDSGGKGLVVILEGFLAALKGEELIDLDEELSIEALVEIEHERSVQSYIDKDSIDKGYCTEFIVEFDDAKLQTSPFHEDTFRAELSEYGDSLLVAADHDFVKIHIHTETPGEVMTLAQKYGDLTQIDIENMRKQYEAIVEEEVENKEKQPYGMITVAQGTGLKEMFLSIGATSVIEGGQTMNPSTEDFIRAIEKVNADHIIILPNNSNIIMAAEQVKEFVDTNVTIIPTKTIPQGISALFSFDEATSLEENESNMTDAIGDVKTGLVTYATRDTVIDDIDIKEGSFIGMNEGSIKVTDPNKLTTVESLLSHIVDEDDEIVTVFYGEDVTDDEVEKLQQYVDETFDEVEFEFHNGEQPIYSFIIMVE